MDVLTMMRSIKRGADITQDMVQQFIRSINTNRLRQPLPITLESKAITDRKIIYYEEHLYNMLEVLYSYIPNEIHKHDFINIMNSTIVSPPKEVIDRLFGSDHVIKTHVFVKRFLHELTS